MAYNQPKGKKSEIKMSPLNEEGPIKNWWDEKVAKSVARRNRRLQDPKRGEKLGLKTFLASAVPVAAFVFKGQKDAGNI